jgi:hypothetical protein
LLLCIFCSCSDDRFDVDVSSVNYTADILRLDQDVFAIDSSGSDISLSTLTNKYEKFSDYYFKDIMRMGPPESNMTASLLQRFTSDRNWKELQQLINRQYPDLNSESEQLTRAFRRYSALFDQDSLPIVVAYNSGYNIGLFPTEQYLGIGLEWYLGSDHKILNRLPPDLFPQYKRQKMQPQFMVPNALKGWLSVKYQGALRGESLLNRMVYAGKINFITQVLLRDVSDQRLMNYTPEEMEWCEGAEYDIWKHLVENDLLYSKDAQQVNKMMGAGPFTPGMPPQSPGGVGNWVGFEMVKAFMDKNENLSLSQLMELKNDQQFLNTYKPGR